MSFLDRLAQTSSKTADITVKSPKELYSQLLKGVSGAGETRKQNFDIFYEIVAFKGVMDGVGTSTLVANTAKAIADLGLKVCVVDTSIKHPIQDILLNTDYRNRVPEEANRLDWFDMPYTKKSVLHESRISSGISVLSFFGKNRGIIDILSTNDNPELVDIAFTELHNKFDIILVDCCDEDTSVNTAALQQAQHVIQVWSDSTGIVNNIDNFINNCATLSCPLDKMRNVVYSQIMDDIIGNLDDMLAQYRLTKLAENTFSKDIRRVSVLGKTLYQYTSNEPDIIEYTECIIKIACHILNIHDEDEDLPKGTITSQDIMDGKVEGTYHKELKDYNEKLAKNAGVVIATSLEAADKSLEENRVIPATEYDGIPNDELKMQEVEKQSTETQTQTDETATEPIVKDTTPTVNETPKQYSASDFEPDDSNLEYSEPTPIVETNEKSVGKEKKHKKSMFGNKRK